MCRECNVTDAEQQEQHKAERTVRTVRIIQKNDEIRKIVSYLCLNPATEG